MGARKSGSAASGMVLYDADEWKSKVHLYDRDCAYAYTDNPALGTDMSATYVRAADALRLGATESEVVTGNDAFGGVVRVPGNAPGMSGCRQSQQSVSVVPVGSLPAYAGGTYRSVALPGQPFSFAGDTILTAGKRPDGTDTIRVDRLYGDQSNEFTIVNVLKDFPTAPPYATLQIGAASKEQVDALPIPYAFNDEVGIKHPSVSTQSAVYFAVNPSTAMLEGFQKWCRGDAIAPLQLQVLSSYGGVRVWRIEPYTFCPVGDDGRPGCGAGHVRFVDLPDPMLDNSAQPVNDPARCGREFTVRVTSLEYLNSDNIAVTALRATLQTYDIENAAPYEGEGTFRVYYYNPGRNALQDVPWQRDVGISMTTEGRFCPAMKRFPALGSMLVEGANVVLNFVRVFLRLALSLPGAIELWRMGRRCPVVSLGHTLVESGCGSDLFSLFEMWESIDRAGAHFWRALGLVAMHVRDLGFGGTSQAASFIEGASQYGQATFSPSGGGLSRSFGGLKVPIPELGSGMLNTFFAGKSSGSLKSITSALSVSVNPVRLARYSYELVAGWVSRILPIAIEGRGGAPSVALRVAHVMGNHLLDSRGDFDRLVLLTMRQGCSGMSLMIGFTNPWARFVRKQCETVPDALNGTLNILVATTVVVPFVHCVCVPPKGIAVSFEDHLMNQCYYHAPDSMKGAILGVVAEVRGGARASDACQSMLDVAKDSMSTALHRWFDTQFEAAEALGPSVSYLSDYLDPGGSACMDFERNPFASVLIPEPYDFWGACGATTLCRLKCSPLFLAFEAEKAKALYRGPAVQPLSRTVESRFFQQVDRDAFMPFPILAMVQLRQCRGICPPQEEARNQNARSNPDMCIAVAGVGGDLLLTVHKYCVPASMGLSVSRAEAQTWAVAGSAGFAAEIVSVFFSETERGDTLLVLRDHSGSPKPRRVENELLTVHSREMQDQFFFKELFFDPEVASELLLVFRLEDSDQALEAGTHATAITHLYIIPTDASGRPPWAFTRVHADDGKHYDLCWPLEMPAAGSAILPERLRPRRCRNAPSVMRGIADDHQVPILLDYFTSVATIAMVPTRQHPGSQLCLLLLTLSGTAASEERGDCHPVSGGFFAGTGSSVSQVDRQVTNVISDFSGEAKWETVMYSGAVSRVGRTTAQNTLSDPLAAGSPMTFFVSKDPRVRVSWLTLSRVSVEGSGVATSSSSASSSVTVRMDIQLSCDQFSCTGCPSGRLQALCNALQQCVVEKCVGSPVDQRNPLCNVGVTIQKTFESYVAMAFSAWLIFVEGYSTVLQLSLERDRSMELRIESLDDAFFGEICVAKDLAASTTAIITSSVNAIVLAVGRHQSSDVDRLEQGAGDLGVGRFGAHATMISTSVNSLLYQLVLLPAYIFVALHKTFVCGGNQVLAIPSALSDFEITLGRADLQSALDRVAGTCMASYVQGCLGAPAERGYGKCAGDVAQAILSAAQTIGVSYAGGMPLDPMLHQIDSALSYMEGIVSALQDVVQTSDTEKCRAPDFFVHKAPHCACGDEHVRIPLENRTQGIAQHAHWCSGMLRVPSAFGGFSYVYNPYSYEALLGLLHLSKPSYATAQRSMLDEYLLCRSGNGPVGIPCNQLLASVQVFNSQQVSPLTILQTCRDNYHAGRWDPAAWLLYDEEGLRGNERLSVAYSGDRYDQDGRAYESGVGACLRGAASRDEGVTGCMQDFLGRGYATAFRYETTGQGEARNALVVDACKVFTGPARSPDEDVAQVFRRCASGWADTGCQIPLIGWSVGSRNALPVANEHAVQALLLEDRVALARSRYEDIRAVVVAALKAELEFEDDNLDVLLFSADGDALHQGFDCYVMGAYSRVDFWTPGPDGDLPVPLWARDAGGLGESREMDLPCGLDKLQGDHEPPFTCGSPTRRSVIKTMVRRFIGGERGEEGMVERLVREKVRELIAIWDSVDHYACQCEDGSGARPECCTSFEERWADTDLCPCLDGTRAHTCCRQDNYLPPGLALMDFDQINSTVVSEAILDMIPPFMEVAHTEAGNQAFMTHTAQSAGVPGTWNWATSPQALRRAVSAGILSSYVDIVQMDGSEAGYPFRGDGASPDRTLWEACTGLLGQLMFSMPMRPVPVDPGDPHSAPAWTLLSVSELREVGIQFDPTANVRFEAPANAEPDETGQSMLQRFVTRLLNAAYDSSPLFWHHAMRHVPSDSLVCRHRAQPEPLSKSLHFRNRQLIPVDALDELPPVPVKGYAAAPLGGVGTECMCGWPKTVTSKCMVPEDVCQSIGLDPCSYPAMDAQESLRVERLVLESWDDSWVCPEMEFSDSWGVVPPPSQSLRDWFAGNDVESDVGEVLTRGRAGLRGANYRGLVSDHVASGKVNPSKRVSPLRSEDGLSSVSLFCVQDFLTSFDANSVAAAMVDDLFPVSRATKDSMPVASCLRFAIEYSKLRVLEMLSAIRDTGREVGAQQSVSRGWARRCQAQLDMMGMCRAHGVFQMRPEVERAYECPFSVSEAYSERLHYVTPGCLVYKFSDDRLYDPCLQPELCQGGGGTVPLASITRAVPFDPRDASRGEPMGYWPLTFQGATGEGNDRMAALRNALQGFDAASQVPRGLSSGFVERLVHGGGTLSPGHANTPGVWGSAEGMASESTGFCDGISDWWPEDWKQPVGYHVTLPCHASETGHRTFDSAFVVESGDGETVKMVYQHDMLRDRQAAHSEFGAAGFCRRGSYGMPRALTNTVRACVRDAKGAEYDAHVPARPRYGDERSLGAEFEPERRCASTPYELPWHVMDPHDASVNMLSVGGVPMWDGIYTQGSEYPDQAQIIKQGVMAGSGARDGWGEHCSEGALLSCDDQHPCIPTGGGDTALECFRGTCIRDRSATQTCYAHADCEADGMLCTGDGRCVRPVLQVENEHGADVEFQLFSERCEAGKGLGNNPPEAYDTYGASPWEDVPDALRMHGMCSYRGWHDYLGFHNGTLGPPARCTREESDQHLCSIRDFKGDGSMWWDSDLHPDAAGFHDLWSTGRFRVHAHQCDRDYMHVQGHRGCSPVVLETEDPSTDFVHLLTAQLVPRQNPRGRLMRTFRRGRYIPLLQPIKPAGVTEPQWLTSGFMSMPEIGGKPFLPCMGMVSCHPDEFRVAGELRGRLRWPGNTVDRPAQHVGDWKPTAWKQAEGSECGMFGMKHEGRCLIDMAAAPFYWSICGTDRVQQDSRYSGAFADTRSACGTGSGQAIQRCQAIDNALADSSTFQSPTDLQSLRHAINSLPDLLIEPIESQGRYLHATGCSSAMHALWQLDPYGVKDMYSTGGFPLPQVFSFHVFLVHTTLEVPYAFWHKCMLLEGQPLFVGSGTSDASMRGVVECDGWTRGHRVGDGSASAMYSTDPLGALRAVDGLITRASLAQAKEALYPRVLSALQAYQRLAPPDGKGVGADHSMVCHQSPRYLPAGSPAFTKECKASLVLWAQKGGVGNNFEQGHNNNEGVPSSCYAFAEPLILNKSTGRHRVNGAYARRVQDNFITGERAVKFFEWLYVYFNRTDFHTKHVRDLDFMDLKQVQDGNTWAGGVLMAEFHPATMPGSRNFEVTPPDRYDGHVLTSNRETRLTQHHEIPCITPKDLEGHLECGGPPEHVPMDAQGCRDHEAEMLTRMNRLVPDITDAVIRLNGELATATYVTPGLDPDVASAINIGGILLGSFGGPKGAVLAVAGQAYLTAFPAEERKLGRDPVNMIPDQLLRQIERALSIATTECLSRVSGSAEGYRTCRSPAASRDEATAFSGLGQQFLTFSRGALDQEFDAYNEAALFDEALEFGAGIQSNFLEKKEDVQAFLVHCEGDQRCADELVNTRRLVITAAIRQVSALLSEASRQQWYDCSHGPPPPSCIVPGEPLTESSFHEDMEAPEGGDAAVWKVIQETNGRWDEEEQTGQCLWLGLGAGALKCHWYMDDGLDDERQELLRLLDPQSGGKSCPVGSHFKSPASNTGMDWEVDCERLVGSTHGQEVIALTSDGEEKPFKFTTNTDAVFYTIYARLVGELMTASGACKRDVSSKDCLDRAERFRVVVKPEESDIFTLPDSHRFNPDQFPRLSVSAAREVDRELAVYQDCTDSDVDEPPDYHECDEGSMGLLERARTFTDDQHRSDGPVVVQNGTALVWGGLHSSALLSSSIPAWAAAVRREDDVFVRSLLNFTQRCRDGVARHAVCLSQSVETTDIEGNPVKKLRSINPWVGGEWNPYEGCDTDMLPLRGESTLQEVFDNYCSDRVCPDETSSPFYTRMPAPGGGTDRCYGTAAKRSRTQVVDQLTVSREAASNLCYRAPRRPPGCPHVQGMLGGLRGSRVVSLYSESAAVPHADHGSILAQGRGLFVHGGNPVYFTGKGSEEEVATATHHGILRMHRDDLGGHHVVMLVSADGQMVVDRVPLGATDMPARQAHTAAQNSVFYSRQSGATHGDGGWRHSLARTLAFEDALVISVVYPRNAAERSQQDWSCPLRRIGFWNRIETADFDPLIPSPMRTERLFGGELQMLYGTRAHPTTRAARAQTLHSLHTSNGFCFCESAAGCTVPAAERDGLCGLVDTIRSVLDEQDRDVRDLDSTMCPDQLDWPFTAGDLRDGMRMEGRPEAGQQASCNFLDRLPKFRYSYRSGDVQDNPSGATTLSPGGVCHMGRASGGVPPGSGVVATTCRSVHKNATHLRVRCDDDTSGALKDVLLERRSSAVPQELLSAMRGRRRRCQGGCTPPPRFYDHTGANELPHGPEASYGLPFRWSAARLLAADVRAAACGEPVGVGSNPECQALMDVPTWTLQGFLDALFQDPQSLFLQPLGNATGAPLMDEVAAGGRPDEDLLWDGPDAAWVLCDPGRGRCYGKIPREEWMDPAQRMGACKRVMRENEEVLGDLARGINLCDMNDRLNSLCQVLQHARQMVIDANCLVAGGCTETEFLYSPASFSQVNNDFSSSVMRDFYELHNPGTSPDAKVCPGDPEDQQLRADSALQTQHCASREMGRLHLALHAVRMVAHLLVEGMAYSLNLVLTLCRFLLMSGASDSGRLALEDELAFWWNKLVDLIDGAMRQISDLVFEVVFENGLGEELYDLIEELCRGVNSVWTWLHSFKKMLADLIAGFLLNVSSALKAVGMGVQGVDGAIDAVRAWGDEFTPINCGSVGNSRDREEVGAALPIATRCWAQFDRTLDSSNPLSCTRADTCRNPSIAFGQSTMEFGAIDASSGAPISCGQCPITDATMASFGCNTVTKFCSCGVRPTSRTACLSHGECALPSAGCSLKSDFTTSDSSGGLQCHLCDDAPVCLVTNGDSGSGQCVCPIQAFHPVACVYQGEANPSAGSLCAVDMGGSLSTSISGSEELVWSTLAVAPCAISGPAFCYEVSGHGRLAVANGVNPTDPLRGAGRRLLLQGGYDPLLHGGEEDPLDVQDELDQSILAFEGWNSTAAPCSTLVFAHLRAPESLGIMDLDRLKSCVYWRRVANESIYRNNLTALEDHTALLLSLADFSSALSHKGVPEALLFDGLGFWADVVLASPWLRPAVSVLRVGALRLQAVLSDMDPRVPRPAWALMLSRALRSVQDPGASEETSTFVISQLRTMGELQPLSFSPPPNATRRPTGAGGDDDPATSISGIHASASRTRDAHRGSAPQRRLLTSLPDDVSQYSALTAAIQGFSDVPVGDRVASLWTQGPLGWPPDFSRMFNSSEDDCAVGSAVLDVLTGTFRVLDVFYRRDLTQKLRPVPFNLSAQIPSMPDAPDGKAGLPGGQGRLGRPGDWASSAMDFLSVGVLQGVLGVSPGQVAATLSSPEGIRGMLHELVACDFESVTLCSRRQRNLLVSLLLVLFLFFAGSALLGAVGLGFLQGALLLSIPSMVIYTAYGVSPMCLPQVPTCLLDDLLYTIGTVLPGKIDWPNSLQVYDGCLGPTWIEQERALAQGLPRPYSAPRSDLPGVRNGTVDCLLRCDAAPFSFAGWEANAAWIVCGLTPSTCAGLEIPYFPRFREAAGNYSAVLSRGVQDEMDGYAVCNGFTLVWVLPYVFLAMGGVFFLLSALSLPLQVATALVQLLVQGLGYTHAGPGA